MSRHGLVTMPWADGTYSFRLGLDEMEEIEEKFDRSIFDISDALRNRTAKSSEILHVLRIGLIGGGMKPIEALALTRRYVDQRPLEENRDAAYAVCLAAQLRVHAAEVEAAATEDEAGEGEAAKDEPGSILPPSTETPS